MDKQKDKKPFNIVRIRGLIQAIATFFSNFYIINFLTGKIHQGSSKSLCVPGLNCYSCPGAVGSCPVGSFQAVVASSKFRFSYYITGLLILIGVTLGRVVCGFLCPFGWFQDLLHKIPFKKISTKKIFFLRYVKYAILILTVWILPVFIVNSVGMGDPYFCKYICPQGILEGGIFLSIANKSIASAIGVLFKWKLFLLIITAFGSILVYRPFCKWICPLGALYALFNKVSIVKYNVNKSKCVSCGKCKAICKMDVDITKDANALECIRCGECLKKCPTDAISMEIAGKCKGIKNEK